MCAQICRSAFQLHLSCSDALKFAACFSMCVHVQSNMSSKANGALMRITPLAVWGHRLSHNELARAARADAKLTHPNQTCQVAVPVL